MNECIASRSLTTLLLSLTACGLVHFTGCAKVFPRQKLDYRTIESSPHHDGDLARKLNEQAIKEIEKGKCDVAERLLQEALIADVTFGPAHNNLGRLYFQHGKHYLAAWEYECAMRLMPEQAEPINNLGLVYETVGKFDEAVANYETAHQLQPDHGEYLANLARARWRRGDRDEEAVELLRELAFRDTRPQWKAWAEEQIVFFESRLGSSLPPGTALPIVEPQLTVPPTEELLPPPLAIPSVRSSTDPSAASPSEEVPMLRLR